MRRPDFAQIETITAFSKIDQTVPCFEKVALPGPSVQVSSSFGNQVAFSRDASILVVSYARFDTPSTVNAGSVYIFERRAQFANCVDEKCEKYALRQILTPPALDQVVDLQFGVSVAISADGSRIAVGAFSFGDTVSGASHDSVFIYDRVAGEHCSSAAPWKLVQRVVAQRCDDGKVVEDNEQTFNFGILLSLSKNGKVLIVGNTTFQDSPPSVLPGGNTYIYVDDCVQFSPCTRQTGQGVFSFAQRITRDEFAANVGVSSDNVFPDSIVTNEAGNTVALSMVEATVSGIQSVGIVQVYRRCGFKKQWKFSQFITLPEPATATNFFGITMAMTPDGRYLVVETVDDRTVPDTRRGFITVYQETCAQSRQCLQYTQDGNVIRIRGQERDSAFDGQQLAISDDGCLLVVGWEDTTISGAASSGKVDVYERKCTVFNNDLTKPSYTLRQEIFADQQIDQQLFGFGLALSGDGKTLAIGALNNDNAITGAVQVYANDCHK